MKTARCRDEEKGKGFNPSAERSESKSWFGDTDNQRPQQ